MRVGIHISQEQEIIRFVQGVLRKQLWIMIALGLAAVALLLVFVFVAPPPREQLAVGIVQTPTSNGSGFLAGSGLVLTTSRVVGSQSEAIVSFADGPSVTGHVLFTDPEDDVALIQVQGLGSSLIPLPLGDSEGIAVDEKLVIVGYPGGSYSETSARLTGKASSKLTTDSPPNPGNSGGPLLRALDKTVVGIVGSAREMGSPNDEGRQWAVPIDLVKKICRNRQYPID
jgi:S1-C subfamily serine protease